ncbi:integrase [Gossypium australe]|uniref:Integrase n=1 Tax=Gossypium australe TaxID=47621 RepID=A0A5B6UXL4_9ROSI|nr:integrase [Gossypium australe]
MIVNCKQNRYKVNRLLTQKTRSGLMRQSVCTENLKKKILNEAHNGNMSIHPGSNKMYNDLKKMY